MVRFDGVAVVLALSAAALAEEPAARGVRFFAKR
jgi:hypothetical protein